MKIAPGEAKKRGMCVWIEDKGKYSSGFAGGKFNSERPDLKMQGLACSGWQLADYHCGTSFQIVGNTISK